LMEEIDGSYLLSLGFSGGQVKDPEKTLGKLRSAPGVEVQLLKAELVAGRDHLNFAARNALHSFKGKRRRSKSLAVEYLLYVSCQRQISKAIHLLGVGPADGQVLLVALSESKEALQELEKVARSVIGGQLDMNLLEIGSDRKLRSLRKAYGVTDREMEAARLQGESDADVLKRLIIERSALLDLAD
jgi:tRNA threonylcarbamoyladenosine modification (KEOPS) complex Cgi121 subunit